MALNEKTTVSDKTSSEETLGVKMSLMPYGKRQTEKSELEQEESTSFEPFSLIVSYSMILFEKHLSLR